MTTRAPLPIHARPTARHAIMEPRQARREGRAATDVAFGDLEARVSSRANESVTMLLEAMAGGDRDAAEKLLPLVYADLHDRAQRLLRRERRDHTLQPTALVNEAYVRLVDQRVSRWANRSQFLGVACEAMHRVLLDHARSRKRLKRGGGATRVPLPDVADAAAGWEPSALVPLSEAIEALASLDQRQATVVKLRYFAGLSEPQVAAHLGLSRRTVQHDWAHARAWLRRRLAEEGIDGP